MNLKPLNFKNAEVGQIVSHTTEFPYKPFRVDSKLNSPNRIVLTPWPPNGNQKILTPEAFNQIHYFLVMDLVRKRFGKHD